MNCERISRTIALAGALVFLAGELHAQSEWVSIAPAASDRYDVDSASVVTADAVVHARIRWIPGRGTLQIDDIQVDCARDRMRSVHERSFVLDPRRDSLRTAEDRAVPDAPWRSYPPRSDGGLVTAALCRFAGLESGPR